MAALRSRIKLITTSRWLKYLGVVFFAGLIVQFLALLSLSQTVRISDDSASLNKNFARFANYGLKVAAVAPHRWLEILIPGNSELTRLILMAESASRALAINPELLELILESNDRKDILTSRNLFELANLSREVRVELNQIEKLAIGEPGQQRIESVFGYEIFPLLETADSALDFALLLPELFGCGQPSEILLLLTSSAEARSVGGLIGQYLQIDFKCGTFKVSRVGANSDLVDNEIFNQHLAKYSDLYSGTNSEWVNSNLIFDLDNLAPSWSTAYNKQFDTSIDFIAVVDTELLSVLLASNGGIEAADNTKLVTVDEINAYLQNGVYFQFIDDQIARKEHLKQITQEFANILTIEKLLNVNLFSSYLDALKQNRVLIYPVADNLSYLLTELKHIDWSDKDLNTIFVGINNLSGSKFDFYSSHKITLDKCKTNQAQIVIEISNNAVPDINYPEYVNRRLDGYFNSSTGVLNEIIIMVPNKQMNLEVIKMPGLSSANWIPGEGNYDIYRVVEFISAGETARFRFLAEAASKQAIYLRSWGNQLQQFNLQNQNTSGCN